MHQELRLTARPKNSWISLDTRSRVHEQTNHLGLRHQLQKELEPLGPYLDCHDAEARKVAIRPRKTGHRPLLDRVAGDEDDRDRCSVAMLAFSATLTS
jgi:hypothetical protein